MTVRNKSRFKCRRCGEQILFEENDSFVLKARLLKVDKGSFQKTQVKCKRCKAWNKINLNLIETRI